MPKPLVPVHGVPMIVRLARQLRQVGARETLALVHPKAAQAAGLLAEAGLDVDVRCLTTPGSFHSLCALVPALPVAPLLLCLVDSVFQEQDLAAFVRVARQAGGATLLGVTSFVQDETPLRVRLEADGRVSAIGTRAADGSPWVTAGVYWFAAGLRDWTAQAQALGLDRLRQFLSFLVESGLEVRAHDLGRVVDVDTVADLRALEAPGVDR